MSQTMLPRSLTSTVAVIAKNINHTTVKEAEMLLIDE